MVCFQGRSTLEKSIWLSSAILHGWWVCLISTLFCCVVLTFKMFTQMLGSCAVRASSDNSWYMLSRGWNLGLWWSRELGVWLPGPAGGFHKEVLMCLFVESSFITHVNNSILDRPYDCTETWACFSALLLVSFLSWWFQWRLGTFVSVLSWRKAKEWLTGLNNWLLCNGHDTVLERGICFYAKRCSCH